MCKRTFLHSIFLFFISLAASAQVAGSYSFYAGDSLKGFDLPLYLREASEDQLSPSETKAYIHLQETQYIQAKYHIPVKHGHAPSSTISVQGLACNNLGFETGDYTNWTGYIGYNANSGNAVTQLAAGISPTNTLGLDAPETGCSMFTLVDGAAGNDPYGAFPMLDPLPAGGSYSVRLGGENANLQSGSTCPNNSPGPAPGECMSQTFLVTTANAMFIYNYAVVLVQAPHSNTQCPYFRAEVLDSTGAPIPCLQYYVESVGSGVPAGMSISAVTSSKGAQVYYMPWTSNSLNLKNYIGHPVTVRFSAAGCSPGGHWGYAYVDATCSPVQVIASTPEVCMGGTLTLTAPSAGSTGTYAWSTLPSGTAGIVGSTTGQSVTVNANGTYEVTVTQAPGCSYVIDTTIAFYPTPVLALTSTNPTCNPGHNGTATATVTGGNTPITYVWSPAPGTGQGTPNASGLDPGTYNLTVTTVNGCTTSGSVTLTGLTPGPTVTLVSTPASCSPGGDGTATATVTGGTGPFNYTWTPAPPVGQGTTNATGLNGGTYTLLVTGPAGTCSDSATVVVTQPNGPTASSSTTNVSCFGLSNGSATINATGGTAPFTYAWTGNPSTTNVATGLAAGTYVCTTSDSKGCSVTTTVTITQPPVLTLTASGVPATCFGKCNGQLIGLPGGGTASYTYSWSNGNTSPSVNNACAGTYTLTLTDAHGCVASDTALVTQPTALVMHMFPTPSHCNKPDGKDSVTVTGGTPGYTFTWSNAQTTEGIHGILAGNYTVIIKDQNGCPDTMSNAVPNLPGVNLVNVAFTPVTCFGGNDGTARDSAYGGFKPYTYNWTPAPGGGQGSSSVTGLSAGTYVCSVTDSAHCTNQVSVTIVQPPQLLLTSGNQKICIGQCATLSTNASGGSAPYSYSWTLNGTPLVSTLVCPTVTTTYTATVTDSHGCVAAPAMDTVKVNPPLEVLASGGKSICPGGTDTLHSSGSGGNGGPYTYTWIPATGLNNPNSQNPIASPTVTTIYTVIVADNCGTPTDSAMTTVTVYPLPALTLLSIDTIVCAPACVTFIGTSNPACASGSWLFGDGQTATGCDSAHHCYPVAGTYNVTYNVTDIHGCKNSITKPNFINALPVPQASFTDSPQPTDITNPTIGFTNTSTNAVSWLWSFGDATDSAAITLNAVHTYLDTGCYTAKLVVTASDGCKDSTTGPICIAPIFAFYAPNTFTPNGDGKNDEWMPYGVGIDPNHYDLMMFDRWGNLMFETHTWGQGWDGRANHGANIAQIDTYVWKVNLKDIFGLKHSYSGHANLIR